MYKKYMFVGCVIMLSIAFIVFVLERSGAIDLYKKPVKISNSTKSTDQSKVDYSPAKTTDNSQINQSKQDGAIDKTPTTKPINVTITRAFQSSDKSLVVRTLIEGQNSGTCELSISRLDTASVLSKSAKIIQQNNVFVCEGFDINSTELPADAGSWIIKVTAIGGGSTSSATQTINLTR